MLLEFLVCGNCITSSKCFANFKLISTVIDKCHDVSLSTHLHYYIEEIYTLLGLYAFTYKSIPIELILN